MIVLLGLVELCSVEYIAKFADCDTHELLIFVDLIYDRSNVLVI